jgi:hypothetical protein
MVFRGFRYISNSPDDVLLLQAKKNKGGIVDFKVIYHTMIDGREHQVIRYDCSHGFAHKDILFTDMLTKEPMPQLPYDKLLDIAKEDIRNHWREYRSKYMSKHVKRREK